MVETARTFQESDWLFIPQLLQRLDVQSSMHILWRPICRADITEKKPGVRDR